MSSSEDYKIGQDIIGAAFNVRQNSGRGLLEKFYEKALSYELSTMGYEIENQVAIPVIYRGVEISEAYRADIIVNKKVIIEVKALTEMYGSETSQLYTYLRLSNLNLGYLINFGARDFKIGNLRDGQPYDLGIYRMVN